MTKYRVQDPEGQFHEFEGPAGATPEQVLMAAQTQFGQSRPTEEGPAPAGNSPEDLAFAAGREAGSTENPVLAAISQAAQQGTFGLQNYVNAGARYAAQRLAGVENPDDFKTHLAYSRGKSQGEAEGSPTAATIGGTAGSVLSGGAIGSVVKGSRFARAMAPKQGSKVANVAKSAATGAAVGGTQAVAEGQPLPQAAQTAAVSAFAAPAVQKVSTYTLSKLQPAAQRAMQTLASTIEESPATLQAAYNTFQHLTGRVPSMAELVDLKSQGKLRDLAKANPTISAAAIKAANSGNAPLHEQLAASQNAARPQSATGIKELRDFETDEAMGLPHPQTGVPLRETLVNDPQGILLTPYVEHALKGDMVINGRLQRESPVFERILNNQATIADIDAVRKALRDQQALYMSPPAGMQHAKNPEIAKEFGDAAAKVEGLGIRADKDYGEVLKNYRNASHYSDGFSHGLKGSSIMDVGETDTFLQSALKSAHGNAGYEHGNALYVAQEALRAISPGSVKQVDGGANAGNVAQAAMAASSGGVSAIYHGLKALPVVGDRVPEKVQRVIADQLFNPRTTRQGINNLRRAGVEDKDIRVLGAAIGGVTAQKIAEYLSQENK